MTLLLDATHDPELKSWVESAQAPDTDFPIQNLPFGRFSLEPDATPRIGVAIGDAVLDIVGAGLIEETDMNRLMQWPVERRKSLRSAISQGLCLGSSSRARFSKAMYKQSAVHLHLPCKVGDYTDFYTSIEHATAVGKLFRPENPLFPNYRWVPIGYHGRASSLIISGRNFHRPAGQHRTDPDQPPVLAPSKKLDFELELGIVIGGESSLGQGVAMADAEAHIFGLTLLNDWSARDIQAWEYQPLGPFLGKNFATTLSPWMVTLDALAPFRKAFKRSEGEPQPLSYLDSAQNSASGALDIVMEVYLQTAAMRVAGMPEERLSKAHYADAYWTPAQLVAHHTVNGCNLQSGDVFGTGTISGKGPSESGSLLELSQGGASALRLSNGQTRTFLEDGDTIILKAYCARPGHQRIGFGECRATILPSQCGA